jgi:hypothetical protein
VDASQGGQIDVLEIAMLTYSARHGPVARISGDGKVEGSVAGVGDEVDGPRFRYVL